MQKNFVTIATAMAVLSAGWLISGRAEAGSSMSAPSKFSRANQSANLSPAGLGRHARRESLGITEYSSSSATHRPPAR
jgi:hypothetical protein